MSHSRSQSPNNLATKVSASVLLPVFNGGKYLRSAVESILNQRFSDFEVLMLNDGSTDDSLMILESYARHDNRCRILSWTNQGLIRSLNAGILAARSEVIIRMDADDICHRDRFEKQLAFLDAHPECVAIGSGVLLIDDEGLPIFEMVNHLTHDAIDTELLHGRTGIWHPTAVIRRNALEVIGGYRAEYPHSEDSDLFLRLAEIGRLANVDDVLLQYRQHLHSDGYRYPEEQWESARRAVADACFRRGVELPAETTLENKPYSRSAAHRKWAWWALGAGNVRTARKHALRALALEPTSLENWRLCACALRGY